jgi:hypothetical protein
MGRDVELACRCGTVRGRLRDASPKTTGRIVCYCDDCQAFLHELGRADLLDARGGTDIVQVAPSMISFHEGSDRIRALRLGPKGLYRFHAECCKTPLGNTMGPFVPYIGIEAGLFGADATVLGPKAGAVGHDFAIGGTADGSKRPSVRLLASIAAKVIGWKLRGKSWPHPFFEKSAREPNHPVRTLTKDERDRLRPLCGPTPSRTT